MLKNCVFTTNYGNIINAKCGEIIYHTYTNFTIICTFCKIKLFEFEDFLLHVRNVHVGNELDPVKRENPSSVNDDTIFDEDDSNEIYVDERILKSELNGENDELLQAQDEDDWQKLVEFGSEGEISFSGEDYDDDDNWKLENEDITQLCNKEERSDDVVLKKKKLPKHYECDRCPKSYTTPTQLKKHIKMQHLKPKEFKCNQCSDEFTEQRSLQSHIHKAHIGYSCTQCDRVYKSAHALRVHLQTHREVKEFVCDFENCGKAFVTNRRLTIHKTVHSGERNYICEICGYRSRMRDALTVHKRAHTGEKPFQCKTCSKAFASSSLLNEHKATHSTERPHKCDVCGAAFARAKALYHHKPLHLSVKKFVCKICGKAYAQAAGLSGHMRGHKMECLI